MQKYRDLQQTYAVSPSAFETLRGAGPLTKTLLDEVCKKMKESTLDNRLGEFFRQKVSLDVQRGNAAVVLGTLPTLEELAPMGWAE